MDINTTTVKLRRLRDIPLPEYATEGAAAVDLRAALDAPLTLPPHGRIAVPTGLAIELCVGVAAIIAARSGLGCRRGITLANGIGVIDSDYRGEISVTLRNDSDEPFVIEPGDRVAQMLFMPVLAARLAEVAQLGETERGAGGFGSTGVK